MIDEGTDRQTERPLIAKLGSNTAEHNKNIKNAFSFGVFDVEY